LPGYLVYTLRCHAVNPHDTLRQSNLRLSLRDARRGLVYFLVGEKPPSPRLPDSTALQVDGESSAAAASRMLSRPAPAPAPSPAATPGHGAAGSVPHPPRARKAATMLQAAARRLSAQVTLRRSLTAVRVMQSAWTCQLLSRSHTEDVLVACALASALTPPVQHVDFVEYLPAGSMACWSTSTSRSPRVLLRLAAGARTDRFDSHAWMALYHDCVHRLLQSSLLGSRLGFEPCLRSLAFAGAADWLPAHRPPLVVPLMVESPTLHCDYAVVLEVHTAQCDSLPRWVVTHPDDTASRLRAFARAWRSVRARKSQLLMADRHRLRLMPPPTAEAAMFDGAHRAAVLLLQRAWRRHMARGRGAQMVDPASRPASAEAAALRSEAWR
jgi:hypothetical protein